MEKLNKTLEDLRKKYGYGSILQGDEVRKDIETISTQCIALDSLLLGGFPRGSITELYGWEGTGKSTLAAHVVAKAHENNEVCAYIDTEYAMNREYFGNLGVQLENRDIFLLCQPTTGEEAMTMVESLVESGEVGVIVLDSVAALVPQAVLDGEIEDQTIGQLARLMSKSMSRLASIVGRSKTVVIFINQLRTNIGVMGYGPKHVTCGGKSVGFYSNVRIELARIGAVKDGEDEIGSRIKAKIIKSKITSPKRDAEYDLIFGEGISSERDLIESAIKNGIIKKAGAWFSYNGANIGQGLEKARIYLKENPDVKEEIYNKLQI